MVDIGGDAHTSIGLNSFLLALNPFNFEAYLRRGRAYGRKQVSEGKDEIRRWVERESGWGRISSVRLSSTPKTWATALGAMCT